jgi:hypothetical protein
MTAGVTTSPSSSAGTIPALIKILLIPSWLVGVGVALMAIDRSAHVVPGSIAPLIGNTVLIAGFLIAPPATLVAAGLAILQSFRNRQHKEVSAPRRGSGLWTLVGLSFLCLITALVMMASFFQS